jgi:hypothetical protein
MPQAFRPAPGTPEQRLAAVERELTRVSALANGSLQIGPNQKSPVPGELIAGRITTPLPLGQPSMTLDLMKTGAGAGPILTVSDGTYNRVQAGNLADYVGPNGVDSPAQYGFRATDAAGNNIFDSLGLIAVMKLLADASPGSINQTYSVLFASAVDITGSSTTFTLARSTSILVVAHVWFRCSAGADYAFVAVSVDGVAIRAAISGPGASSFYTASIVAYEALGPGAHTVKLVGYVGAAGTSGTVFAIEVLTFQLGA